MLISEKHISVQSEEDINEICKPLFEKSTITYFMFARFYKDSSQVVLPSNSSWHRYFWSKGYQEKSNLRLIPGHHLWQLEESLSLAAHEARDYFNIDNKFDIVEKGDGYFDLYGFGGEKGDNRIIDFYFNKLDYLKQFIRYFKEQAAYLINECEKKIENKLFIKDIELNDNSQLFTGKTELKFNIPEFKMQFSNLSRRELECLVLTLRGRTAQEMGIILNISQKTAESYIETTKEKLGCRTRAQLFDKAFECGLVNLAKDLSWLEKY